MGIWPDVTLVRGRQDLPWTAPPGFDVDSLSFFTFEGSYDEEDLLFTRDLPHVYPFPFPLGIATTGPIESIKRCPWQRPIFPRHGILLPDQTLGIHQSF